MITWELPLFRIVKSESITTDFIVQKLEEFQDKYGNVFCPHLDRHGITSQLLRPLEPGHCGCPGGIAELGVSLPATRPDGVLETVEGR